VAILGASTGVLGTARAQYDLRKCFVFLDMPAVNQPEVMISAAATKFDQNGNLTDETAKKLIGQLLTNLCAVWPGAMASKAEMFPICS
jgi:chromate reductase, NAD(P)H dehydrogenase (quinone)